MKSLAIYEIFHELAVAPLLPQLLRKNTSEMRLNLQETLKFSNWLLSRLQKEKEKNARRPLPELPNEVATMLKRPEVRMLNPSVRCHQRWLAGKFSRDWRFKDVLHVYIYVNIHRYGKSSTNDIYNIYTV